MNIAGRYLLCSRPLLYSLTCPVSSARAFCSDAETGFIKRPKDPYDPAKPGRPIVRLLDISRLDLRVGKITTVAKHPENSDAYIMAVDIGKDSEWPCVATITGHYTEAQLSGLMGVFVANLKQQTFRKIVSGGIFLAARKGSVYELLAPPASSHPGDAVFCDGYSHEELGPPDYLINGTKPEFHKIMTQLRITMDGTAVYGSVPLKTLAGVVKAPTLRDVPIE